MSLPSAELPDQGSDRYQRWVWALSAIVCAVVAFLMLGPRPDGVAGAVDVSALPWVNAGLNSITTVLLVMGFAAIRAGRVALHRAFMLSAFGVSTLFLVSYIVYHWFSTGPVIYEGDWRGLYLVILLTHIVLAACILPLALTTLSRALSERFDPHRRIARVTLPLWLYVTVSGVIIVWMAHA